MMDVTDMVTSFHGIGGAAVATELMQKMDMCGAEDLDMDEFLEYALSGLKHLDQEAQLNVVRPYVCAYFLGARSAEEQFKCAYVYHLILSALDAQLVCREFQIVHHSHVALHVDNYQISCVRHAEGYGRDAHSQNQQSCKMPLVVLYLPDSCSLLACSILPVQHLPAQYWGLLSGAVHPQGAVQHAGEPVQLLKSSSQRGTLNCCG
jgi:hypothetical protein